MFNNKIKYNTITLESRENSKVKSIRLFGDGYLEHL